ncbi:MAG: Cof-type HAD-IIB family hydrolase [Clostridiaceae bacterium]|nr:Cof-type HAD-IIB family hydrolase [Clostridiaceae bacterium]
MQKVKLIGLDLDGTVFNEEKNISAVNEKAIRQAIEKGAEVLPVTGRPYEGLPEEFLSIPGVRYAITSNGAKIYRLEDRKVLHEDLLTREKTLEVLEILKDYPVVPDCFIEGRGHMPEAAHQMIPEMGLAPAMTKYLLSSREYFPDLIAYVKQETRDIEKITINFYLEADGSRRLGEEVAARLAEVGGTNIVTGAIHNMEVNTETATKGTALLKLGELLGIARGQIMACGDARNDLDMICKAGVGVAMGNADPVLKESADFITKTNEENGVAYAIEKYV